MKLLRYGPAGLERPGLLDAQGRIRDLSAHVHDVAGTMLLPPNLRRLAAVDHARLPLVEEGVRLGPCVGKVGKVVVVDAPGSLHLLAPSALSGPEDAVLLGSDMAVRCTLRLGVVIGQRGRRIAPPVAAAHVAGYCLLTQVEGGDAMQRHLDTFAPLGPWLLTTDADDLTSCFGDEVRQVVAEAVAFASECMSLLPGDVLSVPWPGATQPRPLGPGETRCLAIDGLGEQHLRPVVLQPEQDPVEQEP